MSVQGTDPFEIESRRAYVVYDARSGAVVHVHRVTNFRGAERRHPEEEEARAIAMARQLGHTVEGRRVLAVDPAELDRALSCHVDVGSQRLIVEQRCGEPRESAEQAK
jgi:predicted RNase H-related nuclease YkuK (DUF458 family)